MRIEGAGLSLEVEPTLGVVRSLAETAPGREGLNYAASPESVAHPRLRAEGPWLGDWVFRVWEGTGWQEESTSRSGDVREVRLDPGSGSGGSAITVTYRGPSAAPGGLRSLEVTQRFRFEGDSLRWDVELANRLPHTIEVGEAALAFTVNTDYQGIFAGLQARERVAGAPQREWHEHRVKQHLHISGHGSYVLLQRPRGDFPCLLFQPLGDTALEAAYQVEADGSGGDQWSVVFEGPYLLAVCSRAARQARRWGHQRERQRHWFHGHRSLLLAPGASQRLAFRFTLLRAEGELARACYRGGAVAVHVVPGMVAPCGEPVLLQLTVSQEPTLVPEADGVQVEATGRDGDRHRYRLRFDHPGQKSILVRYGRGRWTRLLFYAIPPVRELLSARARFIVERQRYRNPQDPYGRHLAFLPYDDQLETLYLDSEEAWQVGASDEYGLPIAMFLAEKNALLPDRGEVAALETYIEELLLARLQDPDTLAVRAGRYWHWEEPPPSRRAHEWSRADSERTTRAFNYPLVANLYHAMYQVGRRYGLTRRDPGDYLALAWRTALTGLEAGELNATGAPMGAHVVELLATLEREDPRGEGYRRLDAALRRVAERNAADPYPFGSELYVDQTAHHHVYALLRRYGDEERARDALRVIKALRAGAQPTWFQYGNEQRGSVCCWYATVDNAAALLAGFEQTGDQEMLRLGIAGLLSFLVTVRASGAARGWFTWWPDRLGFDSRSLDTDMGLYGYLKAARAVVIDDDAFGLVGYCCQLATASDGGLEVVPWDGVGQRLLLVPHGLAVSVDRGELARVRLAPARGELTLHLADPTGLAGDTTVTVTGTGLRDGRYRVTTGSGTRSLTPTHGVLRVAGVRPADPHPVRIVPA